jgi:lysophospholipase L1-like esterase
VVREFAASRPGTQTPEWARAVATHPELMQSDHLHPVPAGADFRARLIARGVKDCLAQGSSSRSGFGP